MGPSLPIWWCRPAPCTGSPREWTWRRPPCASRRRAPCGPSASGPRGPPGGGGRGVMRAARAEGARVCITGTRADAARLRVARELGADLAVDVNGEDLGEALRAFADVDGVDLAFECSGASPALESCLRALRRQGTLVQVGLFGRPSAAGSQ